VTESRESPLPRRGAGAGGGGSLFAPSYSVVVPAVPGYSSNPSSASASASAPSSSSSAASAAASSSAAPLLFCYQVLEALAPWKLEALVRQLCRDLSEAAGLLPRTVPPDVGRAGAFEDTIQFREWKFYEVNRPRQGRVLEWMVRDPDDDESDDEEGGEGARLGRLGAIREADGQDRGGGELGALALAWGRQARHWSRVLRFCAEHVWLGRPDLLRAAGRYLFARPSARPRALDVTSLGLESARLGDDLGLWLEPLLQSLREDWVPGGDESATPDGDAGSDEAPLTLAERLALSSSHLEAILGPFVDFLAEVGLIPAGHEEDSYARKKLLDLPGELVQLYVDGRRCSFLEAARDKIVSMDYHSTVDVEDDPFPLSLAGPDAQLAPSLDLFRVTRCAVSRTALEAMRLSRSAMDEAAVEARRLRAELASPPSPSSRAAAEQLLATLPWALYRSARDALDLFRALVPALHGPDIASLPRAAAVFHNDCAYLAHRCLTLGLEYRDRLFPPGEDREESAGKESELDLFSFLQKDTSEQEPTTARSAAAATESSEPLALLRQTCTFVDMVPLFRDLAEKAMGAVLDQHARELAELVRPRIPLFGPSLRFDQYMQEWSDAESAAGAGLHHLRRLHFVWKPVLADDILRRSMWYLSDVVLGLLVDQVAEARDISTAAGRFVSGLFASTSRDVLELAGGDASASRSFDRFQAYGSFMDMTLADVKKALSDGGFRSVTSTSHAGLSPFPRSVFFLKKLTLSSSFCSPRGGR
jgi:hypothetical protein